VSCSQSETSRGQRSDGGLLVVFEVRCAELPSHPGRSGEAPPPPGGGPAPQQHVSRRRRGPRAWQAVVVGVRSWLEWCIVGVVVGMMVVLMVLALIIMEASISVSPSPSSSPSSLPSGPWRHPPSLSWSPLVTAAPTATMMLVVVVVTVAVGGAVQRVAAVAALVVLVVSLVMVVEAALVTLIALVTLLPGTMRAGGAHARRWDLEGEGQESMRLTLGRRRRGRTFTLHSSSLLSLLHPLPSLAQTQGLQGSAGWSP